MKRYENEEIERFHRNIPQLKAIAVDANVEVDLWGRRTGKSLGIGSWLKRRSEQMPRCNLTLLSTTYKHLRKKILPEIYSAWEGMGWKKNVHYWINRMPPDYLEIPAPYRPADTEDSIFTVYGGVVKLASMDKNAPSAGDATDGLAVDECRLIDGEQMQVDIIPTVSGTHPQWRGKYYYCSKLFTTDKPRDSKGKWVLEYRNHVDEKKVNLILQIEKKRMDLLKEQLSKMTKKRELEVLRRLAMYDEALNDLRRELTFVSEASTFDNVHILGINQIKSMKNSMTPRNFKISIMNKDGMAVPDCFYEDIDEDLHMYNAMTEHFRIISDVQYDLKWFNDVSPHHGLEAAIDWNHSGSNIMIRQVIGNTARYICQLYILAPLDHKDLMAQVVNIFQSHTTKKLKFIYNHTFIAGKKHGKTYLAKECIDVFTEYKWKVDDVYIGAANTYKDTFLLAKKAFTGQTRIRHLFNHITLKNFYDVAKQTKALPSESKGLVKDKSSETDTKKKYWEATHLTEPFDQFLQYDDIENGENVGSDVSDIWKS